MGSQAGDHAAMRDGILTACRAALAPLQGAGHPALRARAGGDAGRQAGARRCVASSSPAQAAASDLPSPAAWRAAAIA